MPASVALAKLSGTKDLRRARQLAQKLPAPEAQKLNLFKDLGTPINLVSARALLERDDCGTAITEEDSSGWTLLHHAAKAGDSDLCYFIASHDKFDRGVLSSSSGTTGKTPADIARGAGHKDLATSLGENGAIAKRRRVSLVGAEDYDEAEKIAKEMVDEPGFDINTFMMDHDFTELGSAALSGLLKSAVGEDVANFRDEDGWTALHYAVHEADLDLARELLQFDDLCGCRVNARNKAGETAFASALLSGNVNIARHISTASLFNLHQHGLDTPMPDGRKLAEAAVATSAEMAAQLPVWRLQASREKAECDRLVKSIDFAKFNIAQDLGCNNINYCAVKSVLAAATAGKAGLVLTCKSDKNWTILDHAVRDAEAEVVSTILGLDPNVPLVGCVHDISANDDLEASAGNNILHLAISRRSLPIVTRLLKHPKISTVLEKKNASKTTPLAMAKLVAHVEITRLIEEQIMAQQLTKTKDIVKCQSIIKKLREPLQCPICCDRPWDLAPVCGHVMCSVCVGSLNGPKNCPTCSRPINMTHCRKLFLP